MTSFMSATENSAAVLNGCAVNYIYSACFATARGISVLLSEGGKEVRQLAPELPESDRYAAAPLTPSLPSFGQNDRVVIFLPEDLRYLFFSLQQLVVILNQKPAPGHIMILSRYSPAWLCATLAALLDNAACLDNVHVARPDITCHSLARLLCEDWATLPSILQQADIDTVFVGKPPVALTPREFSVLLGLFHGHTIRAQSAMQCLSEKTLYHQRRFGLRKLAGQIPLFAAQLPGAYRKAPLADATEAITAPQDREFIQAIYCRQVFPVFQAVIDRYMTIQGAEIFIHGGDGGHALSPGEYFPPLHSRLAWRYWIALMLYETVRAINRYEGRLYFSFKIPDGAIETRALMHLIEAARRQLHQADWAACLVLELSESVAMSGNTLVIPPLKRLLMMGARIMLENTFSQKSMSAAPRPMALSGYKLNIAVVNGFLSETHDRVLIKSLVYSCQLSGSLCIAEGVDTWEQFDALVLLGVEGFQGNIISRPVSQEAFASQVQCFSRR
ncbi:hypothetical protein DAQ1742_00924 [Dickeya aquatica]|uniref:EAL domain-containing protein n=2 Tax=Pectobacteriaceae TaxID=1903410 RepID=A0A375A7J3_9GAMM|nr:hypothetical protein DAQ1742_00924 [Dickeya aquatica]